MSEKQNGYLPFNNTPSKTNPMLSREQARIKYPEIQFTSIRELYGTMGINSHEVDNMRMNHILVGFGGMFYHNFEYAPGIPTFKRVDGIGIMENNFSYIYSGKDIPMEIGKSDLEKTVKLLKLLGEFEEIDESIKTFKAYHGRETTFAAEPTEYIHGTLIRDEFIDKQKKIDKEEKKKLKQERKEEKKKRKNLKRKKGE